MNKNRKILHIDDDPTILRVVGKHLQNQGFEVRSHSEPREAIQILQETNARVMLLDIDMPEMDGLSLLKEVKKHDGGVQVIMLTGLVTLSTVLRSMRLGAEACLFKPVTDPQPLVDSINATFEKLDCWWNTLHDLSQLKSRERKAAAEIN
jgi:DNA-binding NtrC family response regulator